MAKQQTDSVLREPGLVFMMSLNRINVLLFALSFSFLTVSMFPVVTYDFAHHDDWNYWSYDRQFLSRHPVFQASTQQGRPTVIRLLGIVGWFIDRTADLWYVRVFFIAVLSLAAVFFVCRLVSSGWSLPEAFLVAMAVFLLPGPPVYICYVSCAPFCIGLLLAGISPLLAETFTSQDASALSTASFRRNWVAAAVTFFLSLTIYQSLAMFTFVIAFIPWLFGSKPRPLPWRSFSAVLLFYGVICIAYYLFFRYYINFNHLNTADPYAFTTTGPAAIPGKIAFFFEKISYKALNLWNISPNPWFASGIVLIILAGWALVFREALRTKNVDSVRAVLNWVIQILALALLTNIPVLVAANAHAAYRLLLPYSAVLTLLFFFAVKHIFAVFGTRLGRALWQAFLVVGVCVIGSVVHNNILIDFAASNHAEYKYLSNQLKQKSDEGYREVGLILADNALSVFGTPPAFDEYGRLSETDDHKAMIGYALEENKIDLVVWIYREIPKSPSPQVIDMRKMQQETKAPSHVFWPFFPLFFIASAVVLAGRRLQNSMLICCSSNAVISSPSTAADFGTVVKLLLYCNSFLLFFWFIALGINFVSVAASLLLSTYLLAPGRRTTSSQASLPKDNHQSDNFETSR